MSLCYNGEFRTMSLSVRHSNAQRHCSLNTQRSMAAAIALRIVFKEISLLGLISLAIVDCLTNITLSPEVLNGCCIRHKRGHRGLPDPHQNNTSIDTAVMCRLRAYRQPAIPCEGRIHNLRCSHRVLSSSPACRGNCASPGFGAKNRGLFWCRDCNDLVDRHKVWEYQREIQDLRDFILAARLHNGACGQEIEAAEDKIDIIEMQMREVAGWEAFHRFQAQM